MTAPHVIRGVGVSPGVACAPAVVIRLDFPDVPDRAVPASQVEGEIRRLREAVELVAGSLRELGQRVLERAGPEESRIFDAQIEMTKDEYFLQSVDSSFATTCSPPRARTSSRRWRSAICGRIRRARGCATGWPISTRFRCGCSTASWGASWTSSRTSRRMSR